VYDVPSCYVNYSEAVQDVGRNCEGFLLFFLNVSVVLVGRDSSVGKSNPYGMYGPGIESRSGRDFTHPSRPGLGAHPTSYTMATVGLYLWVNWPGSGLGHPPSSSTMVKERAELYLYSSLGFRDLF